MDTIPVQDSPHQIFRLTVEDTEYQWRLDYYDRPSAWYLTLSDAAGSAISTGRKLSPGWNPLLRDKDARLPPGEFYFFSTSDPVGRDGFTGGRAQLVHFSPAEVAEIGASAPPPITPDFALAP